MKSLIPSKSRIDIIGIEQSYFNYHTMPKSVSQTISATGKPLITMIDIFPFKTYGALIKRELKWFEDQANLRINSILPLYKLAKKIVVDEGISEDEALEIVQNLGDDANKKYAFKYLEDLTAIQSNKYSESDFDGDIVTMFIQSRIPSSKLASMSQELYDYYEIEYDVEVGWVPLYTEALPMSTIDDIVTFVTQEKSRIKPSTEGSDEVVTLGK